MKSESTIKRWIRELDEEKERAETAGDELLARIAYSHSELLRRVVEDVRGWPTVVQDARATSHLIARDVECAAQEAPTR